MNIWKLQSKFVDRVLKGEYVYYDIMPNMGAVAIGDGYHYYVLDAEVIFIDLDKLSTAHPNLRKLRILSEYYKTEFSANVSLTFELMTKDKGTLRKFEYMDKHLWINEAYLKEFDFLKYPEDFRIGADPDDGFKKPVIFESSELTAVILPVRVGGQNESNT